MANKINFEVGLNLNQAQYSQLKHQLTELSKLTSHDLLANNEKLGLDEAQQQLTSIKKSANDVRTALVNAFNVNLGTINIDKFNSSLKKLDINKIYRDFQLAGLAGQTAFRNITSQLLTTNLQLKETHKFLDSMATTMANTMKWGVASSALNNMTGAVQKAWSFTKQLDTSLNDIRIVTGKSADEMERFARTANTAARNLGKSTKDFTDASLIYYQQGLDDTESQRRAEITLKTANVTGQDTADVSEQLTAVWNGYKVASEEAEIYVDKLAAVAADTAADLEELSTGMSKVASAASIMGVDIDQLSATLATVISVTRQAPESVGTAFKTIYARMGDIQAGVDSETTLDAYTQDMLDIGGINVLDANNELRDMGEVIEEVGKKWSSMSREQQIALSQVMAGTRQYNNLLALFDNWDMYTDALETSKSSLGELDRQQAIYMESTEAHLEQLSAAWEKLFDSLIDNKGINNILDIITGAVTGMGHFSEAIGGGGNALLMLGSIATKVFNKQISQGINTTIENLQKQKYNTEQLAKSIQQIETLKQTEGYSDPVVQQMVDAKSEMSQYYDLMNKESIEQGDALIQEMGKINNLAQAWENTKTEADKYLNTLAQSNRMDKGGIGDLDNSSKNFVKIQALLEDVENSVQQSKEVWTDYDVVMQKFPSSTNKVVKSLNKIQDAAADLTDSKGLSSSLAIDIDVAAENLNAFMQDTKKWGKVVKDNFSTSTATGLEFASLVEKLKQKMALAQDELNNKTRQARQVQEGEFDTIITKTEEYKRSVDGANEKWEEFIAPLRQTSIIQSAVQTTQALSSMASAMLTVKNIGNIIDNENLTTSEKFLQVIMALGTAIPMFVIGMLDFVKGAKALGVAIKSSATAYAVESITLKIRNQLLAEGIALEQADAAAKAMGAKMTNLSTAAIWGEVGAMLAKKALMVGGILLAIAAVAAATYGLVQAYNADAEAARVAADAANEAAENYEKVAQKAEELKQTISDYSDGIDQLKELTIGTKEYEEALNSANEKAKELIETYGLYDDYHMEDGVITFNDGVLTQLQKEVDLQKQRAESIKYSTRMIADQAQIQSDTTNLSRNIEKGNIINKSQAFHTMGISKITDTAAVSISDREIKGIVNALNNLSESEYKKYTQSDQAFQNWVQSISQGDLSLTLLSKQIGENREGFMALAKSTNDATEAQKYYVDQMNMGTVQQLYGSDIAAISSDIKTGQVDAARYNQILSIVNDSDIQERIKQREIDLENEWQNTSSNLAGDKWTDPEAWGHEWEQAVGGVFSSTTGNLNTLVTDVLKNVGVTESQLQEVIGTTHLDSNEDLARAYAKMSGIDVSKATWKGNKFEDDAGNVLVDVDSREARMTKRAAIFNEVRQSVTRENLQTQGTEETLNVIDVLDNAISTARQNGQKYGTDFSQGMLNALQSGKFNLESIYAQLNPDEVTELESKTDEEILQMFGLTEDQLSTIGDMSATEFAQSFRNGLANYQWDIDKAIGAAVSSKGEELEMMGLSKSKLEEYQGDIETYAKSLMKAAEDSDVLAESLELDADAATDVAFAVIKMNKAIDTLADNFKDWKDILKKSTQESQEFAEASEGMRSALADVYNTESKWISNSFLIEHLEEVEKIAQGDEQAIESLRKELSQDILISILKHNEFDENEIDNLTQQLTNLQDMVPDILVGTHLDLEGMSQDEQAFVDQMQKIIDTAGLTAEQANALFNTMGFEAQYAQEEVPMDQEVPEYVTETIIESEDKTEDGKPITKTRTRTYQDGVYKAKGKMMAIGMTVDAEGNAVKTPPKISGITRTSSGAMNNYSSKNKGGGSPGKSSGGSKKDPDKMDRLDKEPDRYHKVDTQLAKIGNQLSKIQSQEKKFIGADLIANINGQLDQLDDRLDRLREKQQIAYGEADELKKQLAGEGVKFNDDGTIANYMEIYNAKVKYVNDLIDKYNSMSAEEQEKYKETVEKAKEDLDKFTEDLDRYDELVSDFIPGLSNEIQDAIDQEIELNIKKFNLEFDVRLNMKDATKDWNEFKKRILDGIDEDDIYGNAKARATDDFSNMIGENGVQASTKQAQEVLAELKEMDATGWSSVYGDDRAKALEDLKTAYETINEDLMEIDQIQKDVYQAWLDTMDEINDKMADQVAMYEQVSNLIDHDMKVIQLVYGETDYEALGKYYDKQHQNNLGLLDFQRQNADFWEKEMNSIDKEKDPDAWKKARDNWISAVNDLNATVEASIENARDKMENTIDDIFQKFNNEITDGKGLDYLAQQWDLVNDNADDYLDTVNAAFGIRQLENKYQDAIDLTDNVSAQRKLNDLMQSELKALREKDKLTEYDIERANMKYEIALKQIALEEAQQTKTTMRLRRDSQGNYRYEYVADEDAIGKLQDELDVLENSLYNFDKERWIEMQNQVIDAVQERQDAIKEIMMDASLSEEERAERLAEINRLYNEKIQNITDQTVTAQNNLYQSGADELAKIWEAEGKDFQSLSDEEQRILTEEMLPQFETGVNDMITKFSGPGGFEDMTVGSMDNLKEATNQYNQELDEIEYNAGVSFDKVEEGIDKNIPKTQQLIEDNDTLNQEYQEQIDKIKELNLKLQEQADKYKKIAEEAKKATQEAYNYWMEQQRQAAEAAEKEKKTSEGTQNPNTNNNNNNNTNTGNKNPSGKTTLSSSDAIGVAAAISLAENYGGWGTGATRAKRLAEKFTNDNDVQDVINRNNGYMNSKGEFNAYKNKLGDYYYSKFDTGGYTGDWTGNYGKFAMLHSKELVLNAHDTDNMLDMMQIARDVIASAGPRVGALSAGRGMNAATTHLEQDVHIEANFPNVESASEIEEALNNLVQLASQRATRNTRG